MQMTMASTLCGPTSAHPPISQALTAKRCAVPCCSRSSTVCFPASATCRLCTGIPPAHCEWLYCAVLPRPTAVYVSAHAAARYQWSRTEQPCSPAVNMCPAHAHAAGAMALCCVPTADCCCVPPQELYPVTSKTAGTSNYTTPLNHVGVYYFVCQEGTHCIQGQVSSALSTLPRDLAAATPDLSFW